MATLGSRKAFGISYSHSCGQKQQLCEQLKRELGMKQVMRGVKLEALLVGWLAGGRILPVALFLQRPVQLRQSKTLGALLLLEW